MTRSCATLLTLLTLRSPEKRNLTQLQFSWEPCSGMVPFLPFTVNLLLEVVICPGIWFRIWSQKNTSSFFSLFHCRWYTFFLMLSSIFNLIFKVLGSTFLIFKSNIKLGLSSINVLFKNIYLKWDPWYLTLLIDCSLFPAIHGCVPAKSLTHKRILRYLNTLMVAGSIFQQRTSLRVIYLVNKLSK